MTQEQKDLLLKDLCARLPYRVKCQFEDTIETIKEIWFCEDEGWQVDGEKTSTCIHAVKPYLFPLSSMTEKQNKELSEILFNLEMEHLQDNETGFTIKGSKVAQSEIDWYNKNHFDYRGLILMGLVIDATNKNIY